MCVINRCGSPCSEAPVDRLLTSSLCQPSFITSPCSISHSSARAPLRVRSRRWRDSSGTWCRRLGRGIAHADAVPFRREGLITRRIGSRTRPARDPRLCQAWLHPINGARPSCGWRAWRAAPLCAWPRAVVPAARAMRLASARGPHLAGQSFEPSAAASLSNDQSCSILRVRRGSCS